MKILVVEDDDISRKLLEESLQIAGYEVVSARDGEEAQVVLQSADCPQLAILDLVMPKIGGLELCRIIRRTAQSKRIYLIILTSKNHTEDIVVGLNAGADDYLGKPFNEQEMLARIAAGKRIVELQNALDERVVELEISLSERKRIAAELKKSHDELERRVAERTEELAVVNDYLSEQISVREKAEHELKFLETHDSMTKLPNRALFEDRLAQYINSAQRYGSLFAVIIIEPDQIADIYNVLGGESANRLMRRFAAMLKTVLRYDDTVARFSDTKFAVLAEIKEAEDAVAVIQNIYAKMPFAFKCAAAEFDITASAGICAYPFDATNAAELITGAAASQARAKNEGRNNFLFYKPNMNVKARQHLNLETELRRAVENDEFELYYQPQICIKSGAITGAEALLRWRHPEKGIVAPDEFIQAAEASGLIIPIGKRVIRKACYQIKAWEMLHISPLVVSVNISARQFKQADLLETVVEAIEKTRIKPGSLQLELTESAVMEEPEHAKELFERFRQRGIGVSIDDFGCGYSSLGYLKQLPFNHLKIDKSFVGNTSQSNDFAIISMIISLAGSLNLKVIAEGVETAEQLNLLHSLGCDEAQGYYIAKPLPASEFEKFIAGYYHSAIYRNRYANAESRWIEGYMQDLNKNVMLEFFKN